MSRYIDPAVADQLLHSSSDVLAGTNTVATVLFADIRGFTR